MSTAPTPQTASSRRIRVTRWITETWPQPHSDYPDLWFAMAVARFVNWPDSLSENGWPVPWNQDAFTAAMVGRAQRGETTASHSFCRRLPSRGFQIPFKQ